MTVKELCAILSTFHQDAKVIIAFEDGMFPHVLGAKEYTINNSLINKPNRYLAILTFDKDN